MMVGMASKKEKREAALLLSPNMSPAVMVIPEREVPGKMASSRKYRPGWSEPGYSQFDKGLIEQRDVKLLEGLPVPRNMMPDGSCQDIVSLMKVQ